MSNVQAQIDNNEHLMRLTTLTARLNQDYPQPGTTFPIVWGVNIQGVENAAPGFNTNSTLWIAYQFLRAADFNVDKAHNNFRRMLQWRQGLGFNSANPVDVDDTFESVVFSRGIRDRQNREVVFFHYKSFVDGGPGRGVVELENWVKNWLENQMRRVMVERIGGGNDADFDTHPEGMRRVVDDVSITSRRSRSLRRISKQINGYIEDYYPGLFTEKVSMKMGNLFSPNPVSIFSSLSSDIAPHRIPIEYGGFVEAAGGGGAGGGVADPDAVAHAAIANRFNLDDQVQTWQLDHAWKTSFDIQCPQAGTISWQLRIISWDVKYGMTFIPADGSLHPHAEVLVEEATSTIPRFAIRSGEYRVRQAGRIQIQVENSSFSSKLIMFRFKHNNVA